MILLVTGGRDFCEAVTSKGEPRERETFMAERMALGFALDTIQPSRIIHGDCPNGADRWAQIWCDRRGIPSDRYPADWSVGKRAGPERNQRMVDTKPDAAVRFPGNNGTRDCAHRCAVSNIPIYEVTVRDAGN